MVAITVKTNGDNGVNGENNSMMTMMAMMPMEKVIPMATMAPMNHHLQQWIANVSIGADDVIDTIDYHWRLRKTHRHVMAPMKPFY